MLFFGILPKRHRQVDDVNDFFYAKNSLLVNCVTLKWRRMRSKIENQHRILHMAQTQVHATHKLEMSTKKRLSDLQTTKSPFRD